MSKLFQKIQENLKQAQKAKKEQEVSVLRMLISEINNEAIAKKKKEQGLSDEEIMEVIAKSVRARKDSIEAYKKGKREDLVKKEEQELAILQKYLPKQLSESEIGDLVEKTIKETGASSLADIGKVMGKVMVQVKGRAEGKLVSDVVKKKLAG